MATDPLDGYPVAAPELPEARILRLEPGDTLVLRYGKLLTDMEADEILSRIKADFPDHRVVVLDGGATLDVLRRERVEAGER